MGGRKMDVTDMHTIAAPPAKHYFLFFGNPKNDATTCIQINDKPNRLQRYLLRRLLNLYFYEQ